MSKNTSTTILIGMSVLGTVVLAALGRDSAAAIGVLSFVAGVGVPRPGSDS